MNIAIRGTWLSISDLSWRNVPPLAVLTGVNGSGKTQLLDVIAQHYQVRTPKPGMDLTGATVEPWPTSVAIDGVDPPFTREDVIHRLADWGATRTDAAVGEAAISTAWRDLTTNTPDWVLNITQRTRLQWDAMSDEEILNILSPGMLWRGSNNEATRSVSFLFYAYRFLEREGKKRSWTPERIRNQFGEPPWQLMNDILKAAGVPFEASYPEELSIRAAPEFRFQLLDLDHGHRAIPHIALSSGERALIGLALLQYQSLQTRQCPRLMLLDEPDAHLHPSHVRGFLRALESAFIQQRGARVILTTHSPATVALVPEESLFQMHRTGERIRKARRKETIAALTNGYVAVQGDTRTVFLEGPTDAQFYPRFWDILSASALLARSPNAQFVYGNGRNTITNLLPGLRQNGFENFWGLIDRDNNNTQIPEGVKVLHRYCIENYQLDPLVIWVVLRGRRSKIPREYDAIMPAGSEYDMCTRSSTDLQALANYVLEQIAPHIQPNGRETAVPVRFHTGQVLEYPQWFVGARKQPLRNALSRSSLGLQPADKEIEEAIGILSMVPVELLEVFREIQGNRPQNDDGVVGDMTQ